MMQHFFRPYEKGTNFHETEKQGLGWTEWTGYFTPHRENNGWVGCSRMIVVIGGFLMMQEESWSRVSREELVLSECRSHALASWSSIQLHHNDIAIYKRYSLQVYINIIYYTNDDRQ